MRLSYRLALVFAVSGALVAGGLVLLGMRSSRREAYAQAEHLGRVTLTAAQAVVESEARQGRLGGVGRSFTDLIRHAQIATVVVRDRRGRRLVGSSEDPRLISREPKPGRRLSEVDDGIYDVEGPVNLGRRGRGVVQVGFRTASLERRLRGIAATGVQAGVTAALAITLIAWLIGLFAGERLERLVKRLEALAADPQNFRRLGGEGGSDEVSRLTGAFNRMGLSLKAETRRRRALEAEKRELSAMLVHDLKTPMTVIRSGLALLSDHATSGGKREHNRTFELLEMSTARLQRMVEDVLQLAKLEEMSGLSTTELVEMIALARACAKDFGLIVADRKQNLDVTMPDDAPPPVLGDPSLLRRVLDNLVHNAVEHTPAGGHISINVRVEGADRVLVEVSDSGPGVPPEAREELFHKFFQRDMKRHVGNVGLGLALCEKVVTRHGGAIGVGDAEPRGARFFFTLPVAPEPEAV
ncbi:MAG: HAMP domain-containing histidine kinase [Elusimicrobia bacterium]|nr:HAMP domain-containing histidine kinase [Elusimicrobiota bacterium]